MIQELRIEIQQLEYAQLPKFENIGLLYDYALNYWDIPERWQDEENLNDDFVNRNFGFAFKDKFLANQGMEFDSKNLVIKYPALGIVYELKENGGF